MQIITNNQWRDFRYSYEVPDSVMNDQFDYVDTCDTVDGFFEYRGHWYCMDDFMRIDESMTSFKGWHGYRSDSYFSGVLIRVSDDGEQYQVATYIS